MKIDTNNIIYSSERFAENLVTQISKISIVPFQDIAFKSVEFRDKEALKQNLIKIKKNTHPLIYIIQLQSGKDLKLLLQNFEEYYATNKAKTKNVDRVNLSRYNRTNSNVLYVGSSTTNFTTRIKNHLGTEGTRMYSLHLCKWDKSMEYNLKISTFEVISGTNETSERFIVEILEQQFWDKLKPVFGKRSGL